MLRLLVDGKDTARVSHLYTQKILIPSITVLDWFSTGVNGTETASTSQSWTQCTIIKATTPVTMVDWCTFVEY